MTMDEADRQRYEYLEQFTAQYRGGDKVTKPQSKEDAALIDELMRSMECYEMFKGIQEEALKKPELTTEDAIEKAKLLYGGEAKPKVLGKRVSDLILRDVLDRSGNDRHRESLQFMKLLDKANVRRLIHPSEDALGKLAECEKKRADIESRLHLASRRISNLEGLMRLHGIDVPPPDTLEGDVE